MLLFTIRCDVCGCHEQDCKESKLSLAVLKPLLKKRGWEVGARGKALCHTCIKFGKYVASKNQKKG